MDLSALIQKGSLHTFPRAYLSKSNAGQLPFKQMFDNNSAKQSSDADLIQRKRDGNSGAAIRRFRGNWPNPPSGNGAELRAAILGVAEMYPMQSEPPRRLDID